ncbi:bifunctional adenosylcobinamide kinase/adenosylcobinamide-phosphate guanylyltransferase [Nitrospira moscoviensis]|jgi:adenosylcobinamide kinase / adenosylcobinamide-phosphate guanylyltransferase|uniref:Adenosylcobinamide kinase n=1 Tax=Nitrospira moscoviensis TaxID=42253 RepID=A0A0K2GAN4_NITMO|nr:bifunctional adenosylcobinamide kinase/adenosylcobinamide-phosphate guanylyltransferase [Nitrospira moscoviensis]ALA58031.1 Bifunctional adenosylcobalamin biosynthesis protein CobP [Nitrospira moscoviensis]MCE7885874.1 bifunctional adenosylcobinamide kinase/adenosylcobinamide-phosphate guanylyltransferase [Actinobacteria bacterium ATB1]MDI3461524.1 adenosylcobinamide kinase/adenosylcobinamide-phosphate guanylyltransferase [Nitrospira sp.]
MSNDTRIVLIGGGARSGKSAFALSRARSLGTRRAFVATAQALDAEMKERIAEHARTRGTDFRTIEEPLALAEKLLELHDTDVVVIDCLTLWLSNLLLRDEAEVRILEQVEALAGVLEQRAFHAVIVTNEVGMGVVPETSLGRAFRDVAGRAHQRVAGVADEVYWAILGSVLRIRPAPVLVHTQGDPP